MSLGLLAGLACSSGEDAARATPQLVACEVGEGLCGRLSRPLRPGASASIELELRVLPARADTPEPDPLYLLVGGPGQAATEVGPLLSPVLQRVRARRDVVLVDQRGTGSSAALDCTFEHESMHDMLASEFPTEALQSCADSAVADPRAFVTERAVEDLEAVRQYLGHAQINLFGLSYGTRLGLSYLRRHDDKVRAAVFDGVAPPTIALPTRMDEGMQRALELTLAACAADPACDEAFPNLAPRIATWVARLDDQPWAGELEHPRTGERERVELDGDTVTGIIRGTLYVPTLASLLPLALDEAMRGDPSALVALGSANEATGDTLSVGLFLSIVCAEDMRHVAPTGDFPNAPDEPQLFAGRMLESLRRACDTWPTGEAAPDHAEAVSATTPTLLLSGELDPATPPAWAVEAGKTLSASTHIVVPNTGHGTWSAPCVGELISTFIDGASAAGLDRACVEAIERPPFFVSHAGPAMGPSTEGAR